MRPVWHDGTNRYGYWDPQRIGEWIDQQPTHWRGYEPPMAGYFVNGWADPTYAGCWDYLDYWDQTRWWW